MPAPRSLRERLDEYKVNLRSIADQLEQVGELTGKPEDVADAARLYRLISDDLLKILLGEELRPFMVTGELPPAKSDKP